MLFLRQAWALTLKNLLIALVRHPFSTPFRAFILPCIFIGFLSFARFLFIPPSVYGIGEPYEIRSLSQAIGTVSGGRNKLVFVNNGLSGGDIDALITNVSRDVPAGVTVLRLNTEQALRTECRNTLRGTSSCIAAAVFYSSPTQGPGGLWNYSIRADGALGTKIAIDSNNNDGQIYILPLQHAIDQTITAQNATATRIPNKVENLAYTSITAEQRQRSIRERYMGGIVDILAVAFYIGMVGVSYQLTGLIAREREIGMAQLLDSMMPNKFRWTPQAARIIANHFAFDLIYLPGWIVMAIILARGVFSNTSPAIMLVVNILAGLATSSFSVFGAGFFKKAQLSGITTVIVFMLLAVLAQIINKAGTAPIAVLSLLFPPMNYVFFIVLMARWERISLGVDLLKPAPQHTSSLPGLAHWIFFLLQIVVYPILGALVERTLYGTASKSRKTQISDSDTAIVIAGFTKVYTPRWLTRLSSVILRRKHKTVLAVENLNLVARRGEITVYLGANGSGKSTTLDAIAGLSQITAGEILINYPDRHTSLGLCPQRNVLWDDLTSLEHVRIFNRIKCADKLANKGELQSLLDSCDIGFKSSAKSKTLSGGQKRKLQLALMFTGGSTVCLVDEVSSGLDPLSRRKIWDILLAERGRRSIMLTTHFLDEADLLADHIAILSKGNLKAYGTAVELKHNQGDGYRVHVYHREGTRVAKLYDIPHTQHDEQVTYILPSSAAAAEFVAQLERDGLTEYQVSGPTIEDVFLKLAEEVKFETQSSRTSDDEDDTSRSSSLPAENKANAAGVTITRKHDTSVVPELSTGRRIGFFRQTTVLFWKRLLVFRRNPLPTLAALLIPVIAAGLVTLFLKDYRLPSCNPTEGTNVALPRSLITTPRVRLVAGPASAVNVSSIQRYLNTLSSGGGVAPGFAQQLLSQVTVVNTIGDFQDQIRTRFANVTPGGFFLGNPPTFAWRGNGDVSNGMVVQNMMDNFLSGVPIANQYQAFDVPWPQDAGKALQMITYFGLAMAVAPAFLALYPCLERLRNVRGLHYSNGVRALPLWLAYTAFDLIGLTVVSAIITAIFASTSTNWYNLGYLFVVLWLYGLASTLLSYVISLIARSQLAAFAFAATGQAVMFLLYFIAFMSVLTYVSAADQGSALNTAHFVIAAISPIANLTRALYVALNIFNLTCHGRGLASYPGGITVYGGPIFYLVLQSLILFAILLWWDSGSRGLLGRKKSEVNLEEKDTVDTEVSNELTRVVSSRDGLRVLHLTKHFKKNLAVNDVTFGVPKGEVFALLGPNGAGKSTCISLIRGDMQPSRKGGDILVEDVSILTHRAQARSRLGVCPQFDAMDTMTVSEHLHFYARVRGVSNPQHNVQAVMQAVGLVPYSDRMAFKLSGGNKRKLSLGIALMGNPAVLLLDEPSSGMDAASKRVMWRTLSSVVPGRSLVLTTHSMEEADALADRAGIMASKMLALGTTDSLRRKHGDSYYVHIVHKHAPHTPLQAMDRIKSWVRQHWPAAVVEDKTYHGQLRFSVPLTSTSTTRQDKYNDRIGESQTDSTTTITTISMLFTSLEAAKHDLGIEYYNISRATLDQVFLNIVNKHNVAEEGR